MGIYRGPGGTGDATNDAASEATLVSQLVTQAQTSEANAAASAAAAQTAETNAETAETNAETAEANAASSASAASTSASSASTSATNAASSASAASTSASNAATSATNASNSATSASSSASTATTQATNASNSASAAATSATNASNSASAAATSATNAASSATSASGSATSASNSASAASTSASNAATSETNAAASASTATTQAGLASTSATNASNSASAASTSASNAATSATNASNSASAASTSATNASNSASSAATSASNAAASYDSFDDRYLGAKAVAPTVDNDGNTLLVGALYFNTVSNFMKVWDGSSWLDAYASLSGALLSANNLSDLSNTATARTNLGVTATGSDTTYAYRANNLSDLASVSTARTNLGVTATGADTTYAYRSNNLSDLTSASTARTNLGLGTAATTAATDYATAAQGTKADNALTAANPSYTGTLTGGTGVVNLGSGQFYKDASGNIGLGTSSPTGTLDVVSGSSLVGRFYNNAGRGIVRVDGSSDSSFQLYRAGSIIGWLQSDSSGTEINTGTLGAFPYCIYTNNAERMRVTSSGNVGIGKTPSYLLDVNGRISYNGAIGEGAATTLSSSGTLIQHAVSSTWTGQVFYTGGTERMRIDSSGNVGINQSPTSTALLAVNGKIQAAGTFYGGGLVVTCVSLNTWYSVQAGFFGLYVFRDGTSGGNAVLMYDGSTGATVISSTITGFSARNSGGTLQVNMTSGATNRQLYWVALSAVPA